MKFPAGVLFCESYSSFPLAGCLKRINSARETESMDSGSTGCTLFCSREKKPALKKRVARKREEVSHEVASDLAHTLPPPDLLLPPVAGRVPLF